MSNTGPVLPWGAPKEDVTATETEEKENKVDLKAGQRVRVLWEIHEDDDNVTHKWWGARLQDNVGDSNMEATLRYDAHDTFEEEEASVHFMSSGTLHPFVQHKARTEDDMLKDCATEQELYWMTEEEFEREERDEAALDPNAVIDVKDLAHRSEYPEELEAQAMQHIQQLPMDRQLHMADGFRKFMDHMSGQIRAKAQASGSEGYVVTEADVHEMVAGLHKAK